MTSLGSERCKLRVAICGGGIGGLCLAVSLSKLSNVEVKLYEAVDRFKEIGAGVMIWARTWRILEAMGLASEFSKIAHSPPTGEIGVGFDFIRSDNIDGFRFKLVEMPYGCIRFHRAQFLDVFANNLPPGVAHFGKRLLSYSKVFDGPKTPVTLSFSDGTSSKCDILIGADGIKSCIRAQMYTEVSKSQKDPNLLQYVEPVWAGQIAYRGLIDVRDIPQVKDGSPHRVTQHPVMYCGKGRHVVSYSIAQGNIINVVTFVSDPTKHGNPYEGEWVTECHGDELLNAYKNWEPEVKQLLQCVKKPTRWAIHHLYPLPFYHNDRIVLMGDAAHAMTPHQGAGAGQAIEDSFILSGLLKEANVDNIDNLLDAYTAVRLPMANSILTGSYENGMMYEFLSKYGDDYEKLGPALQHSWDWIDGTTLEEELALALKLAHQKEKEKSRL